MIKQVMPSSPSSIINYLERSHTPTEIMLNDLALITFRVYSHKGKHENYIISLHQNEVLRFVSLTEAQAAIKTMVNKPFVLTEIVGENVHLLYEGLLYNSITYSENMFWFETNPVLEPYWAGIFRGMDTLLNHNDNPVSEHQGKTDWKNL